MTKTFYDLDFTPEELALNRMGRLSDAQKSLLQAILSTNRGGIRWFVVWIVVLMIVGLLVEIVQSREPLDALVAEKGGPVLLAIGLLSLILLVAWGSQQLNQRGLKSGSIRVVEGIAKIWQKTYSTGGHPSTNYLLTIQGHRRLTFTFSDVSSQRYFQDGQAYRVYYIPHSPLPIALSAERNEA